jgi:DNA polymerase elongation subunit (family B)
VKDNRYYITTCLEKDTDYSVKAVTRLRRTGIQEYIYDLETATGNFQAGIGEIIVKNTDSIFCKFDCQDIFGKPLKGLDSVYRSIIYGIESGNAISKQLKKPHNLEFEKAIWPFILVTKKRYHGHYYTDFGDPNYSAKSMGIILKRRDNAKIAKHVFGGMVDIIMKKHNMDEAKEFVIKTCQEILDGKYPMDMFIISKTLKSFYKKPDTIAHNVLAMRIAKRDPGNRPQANDRMPYAYIRVPFKKGQKQGDIIETPGYIKEKNLKLNYKIYITNQIIKPVSQIISLVTDTDKLFDEMLRNYEYKMDGKTKISDFFKVSKKNKKEPEPEPVCKIEEIIESDSESDSETELEGDDEPDAWCIES